MDTQAHLKKQANPPGLVRALLKLMRPKQWVKNGFVWAPLLFSGLVTQWDAVASTLIGFAFFCLSASIVYVLNDIVDLDADRLHPQKSKKRPLAAGWLKLWQAKTLLGVLFTGWLTVFLFDVHLGGTLSFYLILNVLYAFKLKKIPVVDIFTIAIGFVLRVYAGAVVLSVPLSSWMFVSTLCLALFLASIKRRQEIRSTGSQARESLGQYSLELVNTYAQISATGALLFYSLFVITSREQLVVTVPLVIFGMFRYWFLVSQREQGESPTDTLLADIPLLLSVFGWLGLCIYLITFA